MQPDVLSDYSNRDDPHLDIRPCGLLDVGVVVTAQPLHEPPRRQFTIYRVLRECNTTSSREHGVNGLKMMAMPGRAPSALRRGYSPLT